MTYLQADLAANIAHLRALAKASFARQDKLSGSYLTSLRDAATSWFPFITESVHARRPPEYLPPRQSTASRRLRPRLAAKPPARTIRKTRRAAKAEHLELLATAAQADKENVENEETVNALSHPATRRTRQRRAHHRTPLTPVRVESLVTPDVKRIKDELRPAATTRIASFADASNDDAEMEQQKQTESNVVASNDPNIPDENDSSDDECPAIKRPRLLRNGTVAEKRASCERQEPVVEQMLLVEEFEQLGLEIEPCVPSGEQSDPVVFTESAVEQVRSPRIELTNHRKGEEQPPETEAIVTDQGKDDPRSEFRDTLHDDGLLKSTSGYARISEGPRSSMKTDIPHNDRKLAPDPPSSCSSSPVKYKVPKPRQRRGPSSVSAGVTLALGSSSRFSPVKDVPQTSQGEQQNRDPTTDLNTQFGFRQRFAVDENGKLGRQGIGALSEIISTPATIGRPKALFGTDAADQVGTRSNRLFRPTNNIYSAKKSETPSVQRALRSTSSVQILHTPGARTPGKAVLANPEGFFQPTGSRAMPQSSTTSGAIPHLSSKGNVSVLNKSTSALENRDMKDVPRELSLQDAARDHKKLATTPGPSSKELKFPSSEQFVRGFETRAETEGDVPDHTDLDSKSDTFSQLPPQPKTAPDKPGPRPRIQGKLVKSALRSRIEKMMASKSFSTPLLKEKDISSNANSLEDQSSPGTRNVDKESRGGTGTVPRSRDHESSPKRRNDEMDVAVTCTLESVESDLDPEGKRRDSHANLGSTRSTIHSSEEQLKKAPSSVRFESLTQSQQLFGGHSGDSESAAQSYISQEDIDERIAPGASTTAAPNEKDDPIITEEATDRESSAEQTADSKRPEDVTASKIAGASTLSNLVSSVSSFLPGTSNLFSTKTDQKTQDKGVGVEEMLAAKRQRQDLERREAEVIARREAQRAAKQKETEEKQRKAENRRRLIAEAEKHREEERRRKEETRARKRQEEEEKQRIRKEGDDKRKEEHRRRVLEQKRQMDKAAQRKDVDAKRTVKASKLPRVKVGQRGAEGTLGTQKQNRVGPTHSRLPPTGSSRVAKVVTSDSMPPPPLRTPRTQQDKSEVEDPQWVMTGERRHGESDSSWDERERRRHKVIPSWAGSQKLWNTLEAEKADPDSLFARGAPSCNLETVFDVDEERKHRYRIRDESGDWTKDRLTAREEMEYKRQAGFFDNA